MMCISTIWQVDACFVVAVNIVRKLNICIIAIETYIFLMANCLIKLLLPCPGSKYWVQSAVLPLTDWVALEVKAALMGLGFIIYLNINFHNHSLYVL